MRLNIMNFEKNIQDIIPSMEKWRQKIHSKPEIAYEEFETSQFITEKLEEFGKHYRSRMDA